MTDMMSLHTQLRSQLLDYVPPDWTTDIATQVDHCNAHLQQVTSKHCPRRRAGPKKHFIMEEIWHVRTRKLQAGRRLHHLRGLQARELLARTFASWKTPQAEVPGEAFGISLLCAQVKTGVQYQLANCALRHDLRRARGQALKEAITSPTRGLPCQCHPPEAETYRRAH